MRKILQLLLISLTVQLSCNRISYSIECSPSNHPFARGNCAVAECNGGPLSKGSIKVFPDGKVVATQQLETDRLDYGVCGWIEFTLNDANNNYIGYGYTKKECIPAKSFGKAKIVTIGPKLSNIDPEIAARVQNISIKAFCGETPFTPFGITSPNLGATLTTILGRPPAGP